MGLGFRAYGFRFSNIPPMMGSPIERKLQMKWKLRRIWGYTREFWNVGTTVKDSSRTSWGFFWTRKFRQPQPLTRSEEATQLEFGMEPEVMQGLIVGMRKRRPW